MNTFTRKGYGRIYVETIEDIARVKAVIKEMDEFEYEYMPDDLIAPFSEYPKVVYTAKFCDLDTSTLTALCWSIGVKVWCYDSGSNEYPSAYKPVMH